MTQLLPNIFAQPLHPSEYRGEIIDGKLYLYHKAQLSDDVRSIVDLPPGSYEIMFTTKDVSKHDAHAILPKIERKNEPVYYQYHCDEDALGTTDWEASFQSLLKSKGLTAGNYLIIKKVV